MNEKKIKICFVSTYAYHFFNQENKSKFGGAELQLYLLATELAKDPKFDLSFVVGDFGQQKFEFRHGVKLYRFFNPLKGWKYPRAIVGFIVLWRLLNQIDPDICVQRAAGLETAEVGLYSVITRRRFCYMVAHDSDLGKLKPYWHDGLVGTCRWWLFRFGLRSAKLVYTQHEEQDKLVKQNYPNIKSVVRPSAHFIPTDIDLTKKKYVLWVARCEDWKDPEKYLDLAEAFPNQEFVMVMPESNDKDFYHRTKQRALSIPNLKLVDYVEFDKIDEYFAQAMVFVSTSTTEGFPNTFVQAFKNKTPVLSLNVNPNGILNNEQLGFLAHGDFEKIKSQLDLLLTNSVQRLLMGENGYNFAKQNHDLTKIVQRDKELFIQLINS